MSKAKILITRKWPESVEAELMKHYDVQCNDSDVAMTVDELRAALGEYDAILPTVTDNMGAAVFETDTIRTKAICNYGVGFSHIDIPAAQAAGCQAVRPNSARACRWPWPGSPRRLQRLHSWPARARPPASHCSEP